MHQKQRFTMSPPMVKCILREVATMTKIPELNSTQSKAFLILEIWSVAIIGNGIRRSSASVRMLVMPMSQTYS